MDNVKTFRANGKLLITGEYAVLEGAKALSVPTQLGQELRVTFSPADSFSLGWKSYDCENKLWFQENFNKFLQPSDIQSPVSQNLSRLLQLAFDKAPLPSGKYEVATHLEFPRAWGLGSSSSLIALLAQWSGCDPFILFYNTQNGSGYDVASALCNNPIVFKRNGLEPVVQRVNWQPPFREDLAFVYLGKKQDSTQEVTRFLRNNKSVTLPVDAISDLTDQLIASDNLMEFEHLLVRHETILSQYLHRERIQEALFADYTGVIKSLGAWGGDFLLVTKRPAFENYFAQKGFTVVKNWNEMILE